MVKVKKPAVPAQSSGKEGVKKSKSRSAKAGLKLSVSRVHANIKNEHIIERIGMGAPVFMAAVLEYVASEVITLASEHTTEAKRKRIMPEDISKAIRCDGELHKLMEGFCIFTGDKYRPEEIALAITCKEDAKKKKAEKEARKAAQAERKAAEK